MNFTVKWETSYNQELNKKVRGKDWMSVELFLWIKPFQTHVVIQSRISYSYLKNISSFCLNNICEIICLTYMRNIVLIWELLFSD